MKTVFYFLGIAIIGFIFVQFFSYNLNVKQKALSYPPENLTNEERIVEKAQLQIMQKVKRNIYSGNDVFRAVTTDDPEMAEPAPRSIAAVINSFTIKNPYYVEIVIRSDTLMSADEVIDFFCYHFHDPDDVPDGLPAGKFYLVIKRPGDNEPPAEKIC